VAHVGDITQTDHDDEWKIADTAFKTIDPHVPYVLCSGNHDMGYSPDLRKTGQSRASRFSTYFPPSRFTENPLYDAHFGSEKHIHFREAGKTENYYLFFRAGGMKFLVLTLEFKPRDEALAWANRVAEQHPDHRIIVVTHAYLTKKGRRAESDGYPIKGNSGQAIWATPLFPPSGPAQRLFQEPPAKSNFLLSRDAAIPTGSVSLVPSSVILEMIFVIEMHCPGETAK
jgi:hypothetical protein